MAIFIVSFSQKTYFSFDVSDNNRGLRYGYLVVNTISFYVLCFATLYEPEFIYKVSHI
jgi:hypothetical protein